LLASLSVVIITFNEEHNIGRCLESVRDIADDIVIVDSYSTDKTLEIARSFNARIIQHKFEGHIEQKNYAITQAKFPFILSLDADEALDDQLRRSITEVKSNKDADGYTMNRLTNYCGQWIRHCGWYPDTKLRLWDSTKGRWEGTNPHDMYVMERGAKIRHLKGDILHYSYYTIDDHHRQINYFTDIASRALMKQGAPDPGIFKLYGSAVVKFIKNYFLQLGFLDGYYGFIISKLSAHAAYLKYKKLKQLYAQA
jgi:glycosyltransferase involved in cell wall biosynthesis